MSGAKPTVLASMAAALGLLEAAPLAQAGVGAPQRHPERLRIPERHPDGLGMPQRHSEIIGVLRSRF